MKWLRIVADGEGLALARLTRHDRAATAFMRVGAIEATAKGQAYPTITRLANLGRASVADLADMMRTQYGNCTILDVEGEQHLYVSQPADRLWASILAGFEQAPAGLAQVLVRVQNGRLELFVQGPTPNVERWAARAEGLGADAQVLETFDDQPWAPLALPAQPLQTA